MLDPILSLTFGLTSQPGTYALLLGSGVSRAASIPTGWEVTLDLVRRTASISGEDAGADPAAWYQARSGKQPDYAELLSALAPSSAAQQQLLRRYFEPDDGEREEGRKRSTPAHQAIAKLVQAGLVKVIVTTNFDRLIENSLKEIGIEPLVIDSPDKADGAPPLVHSPCTVVKVHGDYLDQRIKNSPEDLSRYDRRMRRLLDRIFDDYGLIVCGWSAAYDVALRSVFERARSRRYPLYWSAMTEPSHEAAALIGLHRAHVIRGKTADDFFGEIEEKTRALAEFNRPHPLSLQAAISQLKTYLSEDRFQIRMRDLFANETRRTVDSLEKLFVEIAVQAPSAENFGPALKRIEAACETLVALTANKFYYGAIRHAQGFANSVDMLWDFAMRAGAGYKAWLDLRKYPCLLLTYGAGIGALAESKYEMIARLGAVQVIDKSRAEPIRDLPLEIYNQSAFDGDTAKRLLAHYRQSRVPHSDCLAAALRPCFGSLVPSDERVANTFDRFELLWALMRLSASVTDQQLPNLAGGEISFWLPFGRFVARSSSWAVYGSQPKIDHEYRRCSHANGIDHPSVAGGLFKEDASRLKIVFDAADKWFGEVGNRLAW